MQLEDASGYELKTGLQTICSASCLNLRYANWPSDCFRRTYTMATRLLLFSLAVLVTSCSAKFVYTYPEIARESVDRCVSATNFTLVTIGLRQNCRDAFDCVLEYMPNRSQLNLSSGTALLGFVSCLIQVPGLQVVVADFDNADTHSAAGPREHK